MMTLLFWKHKEREMGTWGIVRLVLTCWFCSCVCYNNAKHPRHTFTWNEKYYVRWKLAERHPVHTHSYQTFRIHIQRHPMHTLSHETFQTYRDTQNTHMKCFIHIQRRPIHYTKPSQTQIQRHPIHSHEIIGTFHTNTHTHTHTPITLICVKNLNTFFLVVWGLGW
jgi:hypothetical protein